MPGVFDCAGFTSGLRLSSPMMWPSACPYGVGTANEMVWCDLGCGQGITAVVPAATHPQGLFYGIDLMPAHIEHARSLAAAAHVTNVHFHSADFATDLELPACDYIVAHGVYSWVDTQAQGCPEFLASHNVYPVRN